MSKIRCVTPKCIKVIKEHGEQYHKVYDKSKYVNIPTYIPKEAIAQCQFCGGYTDGTTWWHTCQECKKIVNPGELTGLFVPHVCEECSIILTQKERKSGKVCSMCRQVYRNCCC